MQASEKEDFKSYLEKTGVVDLLTKVLVNLYEQSDRPVDALEFLKAQMMTGDVDRLKREIEDLKAANSELKQRVIELTKQLEDVTGKNVDNPSSTWLELS